MVLNREKLLSHIRDQDAKQALVKVLDRVEIVLRRNSVELSDFLDPYHLDLAKGVLRGLDITWFDWGGFPHAERCKLALGPSFKELGQGDVDLAVLEVKGESDFHVLSHRDYLGSLLGLGIRREKVGDIVSAPDRAWIVLETGLAAYTAQNLARVGNVPVEVREADPGEIVLPEEKCKEIKATVPSLRLDAVAGEGFSLSRSKIAGAIESGKVKVNWRTVEQLSFQVKEGDVISCRGLGRIIVAEVRGETKKGRIALVINRLT